MTIARKISLLFATMTVLLGCALTGYVAHQAYNATLQELTGNTLARVMSRPDLQIHIYQRDETRLTSILDDFLVPDAVSLAIAYNNQGKPLAIHNRSGLPDRGIPTLQFVRANTPVTETSLNAFDLQQEPTGTGLWSSLMAEDPLLHLTTPVFSPVNPANRGLDKLDFMAALAEPELGASLVIMGYIHLGIERQVLLHSIRPAVTRAAIASTLFLMLCTAVVYLVANRITAPLSQLSGMARRINASGDQRDTSISDSDQFTDIEQVLNSVLRRVTNREEEVGLEHKLLILKADDSATKLSARDEELSKAEQEITSTREQLHRISNYDRLTALPNRHLFTEQVGLLLRQCARDAKPLALLFLNIDNFNRINDSLGRASGDLLLREVGKRLVSCLRSSDALAHYGDTREGINVSHLGGDEFAMVLNRLDRAESAGIVAQRVTDALAEPLSLAEQEVVIRSSIGISVAPRDGVDVDALLGAASTAMQQARSSNEAAFLFYDKAMEAGRQDDLKLESALRGAIQNGELALHYQPQVDTTDGSVVGAEALLRWESPEHGQVSPFTFVALAEKVGLIRELGDWVLVEACRQMSVFREQGLELPRMTINISPQQFNSAFTERLAEVLRAADLPPACLELGLSEGILADNASNTLQVLKEFKSIGVHLSLENFGTSYAPLGHLSSHAIDEIKIDRNFVINCNTRDDAARLVTAIIAVGKSLGLRTVAEGVESEGEYRFLAASGIRIMRGYLFSKPVPAQELEKLLAVPWHYMAQIQRMTLTADMASPGGNN